MSRRLLLHRCLTGAVALAAFACAGETVHGPPVSAAVIGGEWDFALDLIDDHGGICRVLGAAVFTQADSAVAGTVTGYDGLCPMRPDGDVTGGAVSGRLLTFRSGACVHSATVYGAPPDSIAGDVACGSLTGAWSAVRVGAPARVALAPGDRTLVVGGSQPYVAALLDAQDHVLYGRTMTWTSSAPAVATVSPVGLVAAVAPGSATIRAAFGSLDTAIVVTVTAAKSVAGEWDFDAARPGDEAGTCHVLGAMVFTQAGATVSGGVTSYVIPCYTPLTGAVTEGSVSGDSIAFHSGTCTHAGTMAGVPPDSMVGTFGCGTIGGTWSAVRVGPPARVRLAPGDRSLVVGAAQSYTATLLDARDRVLYGRTATWTSSAPAVATVTAAGVVTAAGSGSATITAEVGGLTATVTVTVTAASFVALAPGAYHTCGLTASGAAFCWGANSSGALGDGSALLSSSPVPVKGGYTWAALSAGYGFTCGLTTGGAAYCWGANFVGQLGTGDTVPSAVPKPVAGGLTFVRVVAGGYHACGLTPGGAAYCWGLNYHGQLGIGAKSYTVSAPVAVSGGLTFTTLGLGERHSCGVTTGGAAYCWGDDGWGQLGNSTRDSFGLASPVPVTGGVSFASIGGGRLHSCGLATNGAAYCWGDGVYGEIGNGSRNMALVPAPVSGALTFTALSVGSEHNSALTAAGQVWGWGSNGVGESGDSTRTEWDVPALVPGGLVFSSVAAGWMHSCGITAGGVAYCWGYNSNGQIGDGTRTDRRAPVRVLGQP